MFICLLHNFSSMNILIIEDDPDLNANIKTALEAEHYHVDVAFDGQIGFKLLKKNPYDCIILDINLPYINGFEICERYRSFNKQTPIIMLTALGELEDKIEGYQKGADDYLTKPFFMKELLLRINALIKRKEINSNSVKEKDNTLIFDDIILQKSQKKVFRQNKEINLTFREYQIIKMLMERKGEIVSKQEMLKKIWNTTSETNSNTIEVYINFLRNKLDKPFDKSTLKTKIGYGYYLEQNEDKT